MPPHLVHSLTGAFALMMMPFIALADVPETIYFGSADGRTEIVGYLFSPAGNGPVPARVCCTAAAALIPAVRTRTARWSRDRSVRAAMRQRCRSVTGRGENTGQRTA